VCLWCAVDFDDHDGNTPRTEDVKEFTAYLRSKEIPYFALRSGSHLGYHVWIPLDPTDTFTAYKFIRQIFSESKLTNPNDVELFPKNERAATGIDLEKDLNLFIPAAWNSNIEEYYSIISKGIGVKAFPIIGDYGSGKTAFLKGYLSEYLLKKRIKPFYFENPGVRFYDLANMLLRNLGRYEFAKALWERSEVYLKDRAQTRLVPRTFDQMLSRLKTKGDRETMAHNIAKILKNEIEITDDEEIAYRLALMVVETANKPYFEYRDFIAGQKNALVPERIESKYFKCLIRAIIDIYGVDGVAFLIDEFEDVAISKRMSRTKSYEYLATLRQLIDLSMEENLWIVTAMTSEAAQTTKEMNNALWERFTHNEVTKIQLGPLSGEESKDLLIWWLNRARDNNNQKRDSLFPLPDEFIDFLESRPDIRFPRPLVKSCFIIISKAANDNINAPIPIDFIKETINRLYPHDEEMVSS